MSKNFENNSRPRCPIFKYRSDQTRLDVSFVLHCVGCNIGPLLTRDDKEKADVTYFKTAPAQTMEKDCNLNILVQGRSGKRLAFLYGSSPLESRTKGRRLIHCPTIFSSTNTASSRSIPRQGMHSCSVVHTHCTALIAHVQTGISYSIP
jgi:hypothetical protein